MEAADGDRCSMAGPGAQGLDPISAALKAVADLLALLRDVTAWARNAQAVRLQADETGWRVFQQIEGSTPGRRLGSNGVDRVRRRAVNRRGTGLPAAKQLLAAHGRRKPSRLPEEAAGSDVTLQ
jgi:hypothetical protein